MGFWPGTPAESRLKVATVFYDKLILPVEGALLDSTIGHFETEGIDGSELRSAWTSMDRVSPSLKAEDLTRQVISPDQQLCWDKKGNIRRGLRGAVDESVADSLGMSQYRARQLKKQDWLSYVREANAIAVSATGSARVWAWLRQHLPVALVGFYAAEVFAAKAVLLKSAAPRSRAVAAGVIQSAANLYEGVEAYVPSVRTLSWEAVMELRRDPRVHDFRAWLFTQGLGHTAGESERRNRAVDHLWSAISRLKVTVRSEIIKGVASNVPLPLPVNPISVALSANAVMKARRFEKEYNWLLFLHELATKPASK